MTPALILALKCVFLHSLTHKLNVGDFVSVVVWCSSALSSATRVLPGLENVQKILHERLATSTGNWAFIQPDATLILAGVNHIGGIHKSSCWLYFYFFYIYIFFIPACNNCHFKPVCGGVHPLVSLFVCSVARGGDDKPITSVLLRSVGVCESGKDGGINEIKSRNPANIYSMYNSHLRDTRWPQS